MICKLSGNYDLYKFPPEPTPLYDFETPLTINESMAMLPYCPRFVRKPQFSSSRSPFLVIMADCFTSQFGNYKLKQILEFGIFASPNSRIEVLGIQDPSPRL